MRPPVLYLLFLAVLLSPLCSAQSQEGSVATDGVEIHYRVFGEGPPLLLLNGGPGWSSDHMVPVAERLARTHRVVLFDQRGTGRSQPAVLDSTTITLPALVDDIEAVRSHLGVDSWTVMGHSFGGLLAMAYAAAYPAPIDALVLSAPAGPTLAFLDYYQASLSDRLLPYEREAIAFWSDPERVGAAPKKAAYEIARATVGAFLYDRTHLDEMLAVLDEETWSMATSNLVWADLARTDFDVREPLKEFSHPVLVVQGRQDALGDLHAHEVAEVFPNATLEIVEESAHILWLDQPETYYGLLDAFLAHVPRL